MTVTKRIFPRPPAVYGPGSVGVGGSPYTYTRNGGLDALTTVDGGATGLVAQSVQGLLMPFDPIPDMDYDGAPTAIQFGTVISGSTGTVTYDLLVTYLGGTVSDQVVFVGVIAATTTPTLYTFNASPTQLAEPELGRALLFGLIVLQASIAYSGTQPAGVMDAAWLDVTYTPAQPLVGGSGAAPLRQLQNVKYPPLRQLQNGAR